LAGERKELAGSAQNVVTDMFRAKRILLRDELPDFENAPRFASRELKALGLSSFGRAAI